MPAVYAEEKVCELQDILFFIFHFSFFIKKVSHFTIMKKNYWLTGAVLLMACALFVYSGCKDKRDAGGLPTDDSSQFVTLTDAVPDAIL